MSQYTHNCRLLARRCHQWHHVQRPYLSTCSQTGPKVCIIGSGPAGFYTAQQILKGNPSIHVDILDRLPLPYGLVRFGVAPDHPEVKNVINTFAATAENERCSFVGNVSVGKDVSIHELQQAYNVVVLSYGAEADRELGIPGEGLVGVESARSFVGWYNGLPEHRHLQPNLNTEVAVVIGQGNVALDIARILLTPIRLLQETDITEYALEALTRSKIRRVHVVGRRGPLQAAFTIKELREMVTMPDCRTVFTAEDFSGVEEALAGIPRPRKRLTELMLKSVTGRGQTEQEVQRLADASREFYVKFLRSPIQVLPSADGKRLRALELAVNVLEGSGKSVRARSTDDREVIDCGLILRSVGYRSVAIEKSIPFDHSHGTIAHENGKVNGKQGLYCSGWVKRGPTGVILDTMSDGFQTGKLILRDIESGVVSAETRPGSEAILRHLSNKGVQTVSFDDWKRIDAVEIERGRERGKPREKLTDLKEMLRICTER
ncbi:PREDICTED: NADPH:adrenodoxin oxidoreductase, mitochondrial-like isoform X3 [Priapulus caudatus]|nr:PREDICTED: NADPH:adrenodoxin oxidoreductase, mitochondrial-like isoform X3 [Priapulus caudatus]XP_014671728.1 PREDICTED: NADPH:adrenodoxin oxidoreductase, mitochondrial-like isoform X3 [Priapulus caudatus]XP_014671729.1 PREDICTED: NADPH:adrenodoxin oxidoreductase, mitochondrial-like isoform X3 [Priapulus caudatus]XP_014671730.1 PREDICTED: NADPH:adrenodoxin oxidoreductase, mitochondrial-like isoform X3 [Priapulus caudatus]